MNSILQKLQTMNKMYLVLSVFTAFCLVPMSVGAAVIYVLPAGQEIYEHDTFIAEVRLNTEGVYIKEIDVQGVFVPDKIEIVDVFLGGAVATQADFSNEQGVFTFTGESESTFEGDVLIGRAIFLAKEKGKTTLQFESQDIRVDKTEDTIEVLLLEGVYTIIEKPQTLLRLSSPTHRDPTAWYRGTTLRMRLDFTEGSEYSFILSQDPLVDVDDIPDRPEGELRWIGEMEYAWLDSGIYYFHVRECAEQFDDLPAGRQEFGAECIWGPRATFRAMIDAIAPKEFIPRVVRIDDKYSVVFAATDMLSGIDYYEIAEVFPRHFFEIRNNEEIVEDWFLAESPFLLKDQRLRSRVIVKAVDHAGNTRIVEIAPLRKFGWEDVWSLFLFALVIAIGVWVLIRRKAKPVIKP